MPEQHTQTALGERYFDTGATLITSTSGSITGRFWRLLPLTDIQITSATTPDLIGSLNNQTITAGVEVRLCIKQLELASGAALLFN